MKLTQLKEAKYRGRHARAVHLVFEHSHFPGETEWLSTEVLYFSREMHASTLHEITEGEEISRGEGVRRINLRYNDNNSYSSADDDEQYKSAVEEFMEKTNRHGKFFYTDNDDVDRGKWTLTFIPSFGFDNRLG